MLSSVWKVGYYLDWWREKEGLWVEGRSMLRSEKLLSFSRPKVCCSDLPREAKRKHRRLPGSPITNLFLLHWKYVSSYPGVAGVPGRSQVIPASPDTHAVDS